MYEDNEKKINWLDIFKKLIKIVIVILVVLGLIALITRCTKNTKKNNVIEPEPVNLSTELDKIQDATLKYITKDTLPTETGASKTVKLKYLINKGLIETVSDATGTKCDENESYSEVTKLTNNYALKTSLTCGKNTQTKTVYIGCFTNCDGGICIGKDSDKGICTVTTNNNKSTTEPVNNIQNNSTTSTNTTTINNTNNSNAQTNNNININTTTPVNNNSKPTETNVVTEPEKVKVYEYRKDNSVKVCEEGVLNSNGECAVSEVIVQTQAPIENKSTTYKSTTKTETITTKNPASIKNTSTITYTYIGIENGYYKYKKTTKISTPITNITYSCKDKTYTYDKDKNICKKSSTQVMYYAPKIIEDYEYKWSSKDLGSDWVKTGRFKLQ